VGGDARERGRDRREQSERDHRCERAHEGAAARVDVTLGTQPVCGADRGVRGCRSRPTRSTAPNTIGHDEPGRESDVVTGGDPGPTGRSRSTPTTRARLWRGRRDSLATSSGLTNETEDADGSDRGGERGDDEPERCARGGQSNLFLALLAHDGTEETGRRHRSGGGVEELRRAASTTSSVSTNLVAARRRSRLPHAVLRDADPRSSRAGAAGARERAEDQRAAGDREGRQPRVGGGPHPLGSW